MKSKKVLLGVVGVDSGQLMICDPCYISSEYVERPAEDMGSGHTIYQHVMDGKLWQFTYGAKPRAKMVNAFAGTYADVIPEYGKCPNDLIKSGEFVETEFDPQPNIPEGEFSYESICKVTRTEKLGGQLNYKLGHEGVAVAFSSGLGDGTYNVYANVIDHPKFGKRVKSVTIECLTAKELKQMERLIG